MRRTIPIEVSEETYAYLEVLAREHWGSVRDVVGYLVQSAADGVRRPGSWERPWIEQCFGDDFTKHLQQSSTCEFYDVPRPQEES